MIGAGLTLVTGNTGSGKTALVVQMMMKTPGRPLFVMGIPELQLEHFKCPPVEEWTELRPDPDDPSLLLPYFTFPPNAIVVIDEAQRIYRPRPVGAKVPDFVSAFETRRHTGVDFVLLTQAPGFIDSHCRKLVKRHIHIHETSLGRYKLEWVGLGDPEAPSSRELAQREKYSPPKEVFGLYKSAELHTKEVKKRPWLVYAFVPLVLALIGGGFYIKHRMDSTMKAKPDVSVSVNGGRAVNSSSSSMGGKPVVTVAEYVDSYKPRIPGLAHTAPVYDAVTQPVEPPEPVGCMDSKKTGCRCYTQQGTAYDTSEAICRQIMARGMFMPWKKSEPVKVASVEKSKPKEEQSAVPAIADFIPAQVPGTLTPDRNKLGQAVNDSTNPKYNVALRSQ